MRATIERIIRRFGRFPHRNEILGRHTHSGRAVNSSNPADLAGERLKLNPALIESPQRRRMYSLAACR